MTAVRPLRLGTRASALAMTQSGLVADALRALGVPVELVTIRTLGDQRPPDTTWGEGAFVGALETALLSGRGRPRRPQREGRPDRPRTPASSSPPTRRARTRATRSSAGSRGLTLDDLPTGSRVGTDSPRRGGLPPGPSTRPPGPPAPRQRRHPAAPPRRRRDRRPHPRGGRAHPARPRGRIGQVLPPEIVPPAPGQGVARDPVSGATTRPPGRGSRRLDDPATRVAVETERAFLHASGGGCRAPIGGLARVEDGEVVLAGGSAGIEAPDAQDATDDRPIVAWGETRGPIADRVGAGRRARRPAERRARRARPAGPRTAPRAGPRDPDGRPGRPRSSTALDARGLEVDRRPDDRGDPRPGRRPARRGRRRPRALRLGRGHEPERRRVGPRRPSPASARTRARRAGPRWVRRRPRRPGGPRRHGRASCRAETDGEGDRRRAPGRGRASASSSPGRTSPTACCPTRLRARGRDRRRGRSPTGPSRARRRRARRSTAAFAAGPFDAVVFTSGSTVRGLLALLTPQDRRVALRSTAWLHRPGRPPRVARELGFGRVARGDDADRAEALAAGIAADLDHDRRHRPR